MKNTPSHNNHTHHSSTTCSSSLAATAAGQGDAALDIPDLVSGTSSIKEQQQQRVVSSSSTPQRLNANFRLSTALSSPAHHHQAAAAGGGNREAPAQQSRDWTGYSCSSFPLQQQSYQQQQQQGLCSLVVGETYDHRNLDQQERASISLFATPSLPASMTAAAANVVAKFEPGSQMSMATASSSSTPSTGFSSATGNWSNNGGMPSDWEQLAAAAAIGRGHGLEPRMINTPPYYNPAANYVAASNAAYLYSPQHCYGLQQRTSSNTAAPFHNYLAATNTAAVAAAGCLNYGTTAAAASYGSASTNLTDYYGFNYYSGGSAGSMLNPSSNVHDFGGTSRTTNYCNSVAAAGHSNSYKSSSNSRTASNRISNNNTATSNHISPTAVIGCGGGMEGSNNSGLAGTHQLSPSIKAEKTKRPKKRKLATANVGTTTGGGVPTASPTEPNNTRVFVWELEDLCSVLASHPYGAVDTFMLQVIEQILRCAFLLEHLDDCDQANIEDAEVEESMHESFPCNLLATSTANGLCSSTKSNASTSLSDCGVSSHASVSSPTSLLSLAQQPTNPSNSSGAHNFPSIVMPTTNSCQITDAVLCGLANDQTTSTVNRSMLEGLRRIAAKYQNIKSTYERFKNNLPELLDFCGMSTQGVDIIERFQSYDKISGCQTERYKRCLKIINNRSEIIKDRCTNVVFASESLASSLAKLMAFDLAHYVPAGNVYSTTKNGKEAMLARICERFRKQHIVMISSSSELGVLAKKENIPFWKISSLSDVDALYFALDTILLADTGTSNQQSYLAQTKC